METLFVTKGARLRRRENTLIVAADGRSRRLPIEGLRHVVLLGQSELNSALLCLCGAHGVRLSIFDWHGYCKGSFEPIEGHGSGVVKLAHAAHVLDERKAMALAREMVRGAAANMIGNLRYHLYRGGGNLRSAVDAIVALERNVVRAGDRPTLMGIEGNMRLAYYDAWRLIDGRLAFGRRVRRPPNNAINCLISFLNQLAYTTVRHEIAKTHLEPTFGFLHAPGSGRASLGLDLVEPFKPVLVDRLIFRLVRKGALRHHWFEQHEGVCLLTEAGRRAVTEAYAGRLEESVAGYSFREWIRREALGIERHVLGLAEYESFKTKV